MRFKGIFLIGMTGLLLWRCATDILNAPESLEPGQDALVLTTEESGYTLSVSLLDHLIFLEHVYSKTLQAATATVIAAGYGSGNLYVSKDLGVRFRQVYKSGRERWKGCLTTESGRHLLWDDISSRIYIFDADWNLIQKVKNGDYCWHGSWGIGASYQTVLYAEYAGDVELLSVWRSEDEGDHWERVFSQCGRLAETPQIRHFHTVQPDPYFPFHWYLSSGDDPQECRIWKSVDDGLTWADVTDPVPEGTVLLQVHRFTALAFDASYLYWGTDDPMDGSAKMVRARRNEPLEVEVVNTLGNLIRGVISTSYGMLFLSERKVKQEGRLLDFTIHLSPDKCQVQEIYRISDNDTLPTGFSYSRTSIASREDVFFTYFDGSLIFPGKTGMLKWRLSNP